MTGKGRNKDKEKGKKIDKNKESRNSEDVKGKNKYKGKGKKGTGKSVKKIMTITAKTMISQWMIKKNRKKIGEGSSIN